MEFKDLVGKTFVSIENKDNEELIFTTIYGEKYRLYHDTDCCENVRIEDICGNLDKLIGSPILVAEEVSFENDVTPQEVLHLKDKEWESYTWTFYKLRTMWESVDFEQME